MSDELVIKARQLRLVLGSLLDTCDSVDSDSEQSVQATVADHEAAYELAWEVEKLAELPQGSKDEGGEA